MGVFASSSASAVFRVTRFQNSRASAPRENRGGVWHVPHGVAHPAPVLVPGSVRVPHVQIVAILLEHGVQHLEPPAVGLAQVRYRHRPQRTPARRRPRVRGDGVVLPRGRRPYPTRVLPDRAPAHPGRPGSTRWTHAWWCPPRGGSARAARARGRASQSTRDATRIPAGARRRVKRRAAGGHGERPRWRAGGRSRRNVRERAREPCAWPSRVGVRGARECPVVSTRPRPSQIRAVATVFFKIAPGTRTSGQVDDRKIETTRPNRSFRASFAALRGDARRRRFVVTNVCYIRSTERVHMIHRAETPAS